MTALVSRRRVQDICWMHTTTWTLLVVLLARLSAPTSAEHQALQMPADLKAAAKRYGLGHLIVAAIANGTLVEAPAINDGQTIPKFHTSVGST